MLIQFPLGLWTISLGMFFRWTLLRLINFPFGIRTISLRVDLQCPHLLYASWSSLERFQWADPSSRHSLQEEEERTFQREESNPCHESLMVQRQRWDYRLVFSSSLVARSS